MTRKTSFYYSFLVLPAAQRRAILAVFDFCRAVDDSVDLEPDPVRAGAALDLWRAEVACVFDGGQPATPQGRALQPFAVPFNLPRAQFEALIDGVAMDAPPRRYETFADLEPYCHRVASSVGLMCAAVFGVTDPAALTYARDLGVALQLTNILRDVGADYRRGRCYLPLEDLARFGCREDDIRYEVERGGRGIASERVRAVLDHQAARARLFFARADRALPREHVRRFLAARIMEAIYRDLLRRIEAARYEVFGPVIRVPRPAQARLALRTYFVGARRHPPARSSAEPPAPRAASSQPRDTRSQPDVLVIGAGVAGLSAAVRLAAAGRRVLVVEAAPRPGGRASTFTDPATGERVDNGQHVLFGCYRDTYEFLETIGTARLAPPDRQLRVAMADASGNRHVLACPPFPAPWHLLAGVLGWNAVPFRDRWTALRLARVLRRPTEGAPDLPPLPNALPRGSGGGGRVREATVSSWLSAQGQSRELSRWLWRPLAFAALNQSPDEAGAAPFVRVLQELFGPRPDAAAMAIPSVPLDDLFSQPAARFIEAHGGVLLTKTPASLSIEAGRLVAHFRGSACTPKAIIAAVPWHAFGRLWPAGVPEALSPVAARAAGMAASPIVTTNVWFDRAVSAERCVGLVDGDVHWAFEKRAIFGEGATRVAIVASGASRLASMSNDDVAGVALSDLRRALPAARTARVHRSQVVRERQATFSLAPGQPPRPGTTTPLPGFFLAGDWIDTGLPATIESAVRSGHAAADAVQELLATRDHS